MSNENCYGCINLKQLNKEELEKSIEGWMEAKAKDWYKNIADTSPIIARCKIQGKMTGIDIIRFDNCENYKLGEKNKEQVFEEFKKSGYYGEVVSEGKTGIKQVHAFIPKDIVEKLKKKKEAIDTIEIKRNKGEEK